jgi:ethanolamine utilization protein EutQ (cupin superfamily)
MGADQVLVFCNVLDHHRFNGYALMSQMVEELSEDMMKRSLEVDKDLTSMGKRRIKNQNAKSQIKIQKVKSKVRGVRCSGLERKLFYFCGRDMTIAE